jgi:hypothetical protein
MKSRLDILIERAQKAEAWSEIAHYCILVLEEMKRNIESRLK